MKEQNIDICAIQETHIDYNEKIHNNEYDWYMSGAPGKIFSGVGFIIKTEIMGSIIDIEPINDRIIKLILNYKIPICLICVYAPTAGAYPEDKEAFYQKLQETSQTTRE